MSEVMGEEIIEATEASKLWGQDEGYLHDIYRNHPERLLPGAVTESDGKLYITLAGMETLTGWADPRNYGEPYAVKPSELQLAAKDVAERLGGRYKVVNTAPDTVRIQLPVESKEAEPYHLFLTNVNGNLELTDYAVIVTQLRDDEYPEAELEKDIYAAGGNKFFHRLNGEFKTKVAQEKLAEKVDDLAKVVAYMVDTYNQQD
ncbi:hypothetical protein HCX99_06900 [Limosilactobacillus fermentum]